MSSSGFAALCSAFGRYDVVHIHAEGPAFFAWLPKLLGKRVVVTIHGIDWQREKWQSGLGSKFIHQGEKNAAKYADEVIVLSKGMTSFIVDCSISNKYPPSPTVPFKNTSGEISIQKSPRKSCKGHKQPATQPSGICSPP